MEYLPIIIPSAILLFFLIWFIGNYNALVRLRNTMNESWSDIDTELKRRYDLIPNLVNTVKGYAAHEKDLFERIVQARTAAIRSGGSPKSQALDENVLVSELRQLFVVVENYPELKSNENFLKLQRELANTENRIQRARRFFNANVRDLNNRCEVFPSNLIANCFGFEKADFFEVENASIREAPSTEF